MTGSYRPPIGTRHANGSADRTAGRGLEQRTCFFCLIPQLLVLAELGKVMLEHSCEDGHKNHQQQEHQHRRVDDREPVDLHMLRQEALLPILLHTLLELQAPAMFILCVAWYIVHLTAGNDGNLEGKRHRREEAHRGDNWVPFYAVAEFNKDL